MLQNCVNIPDRLSASVSASGPFNPRMCPWFPGATSILPPLRAIDVTEDTIMKKYCKTIYDNPRNESKAKIEMYIGTSLPQHEWIEMMSDYLNSEHHSKIYPNNTNGPNSINIGFAVMSSAWCNLHAMGNRLSKASGIEIGCKAGKIVLPGEYNNNEYIPGSAVDKAILFYADRSDKDDAILYLDKLLTGAYNSEQMALCPLMKFCLKPGELAGGNQDKLCAKMKKRQEHFTQNIKKEEKMLIIMGDLDATVNLKETVKKQRTTYTLRKMIMMLKNPMEATQDSYPKLFYDVDRVGNSSNIRFIYFKFLQSRAMKAADSLLALLQRSYSDDFDFEAHFSLNAIEDACRHTWTFRDGGFAQGKERSGPGIPRGMMIMCRNYDSDASTSSDEDNEDASSDGEVSRGFLPRRFQTEPKLPPSILRDSTYFAGLLNQDTIGNREELVSDAFSTDNKTRVPQGDDDSLGNSTIQTNHTHATMKQLRFEGIGENETGLGDDARDDDDQTKAIPPNANDDRARLNNDQNSDMIDIISLDDDNQTKAPQGNLKDDRDYLSEEEDCDTISALSNATGGTRLPSATLQNLQLSSDAEDKSETTRTNHPQSNETPRQDSDNESADGVSG